MTSSESRRGRSGQLHVEPISANSRARAALEPLHDGLQDHELRESPSLLVAVDPPLEVDPAEPLDADPPGGVDEVPDLPA
jgi:hypothetical protein